MLPGSSPPPERRSTPEGQQIPLVSRKRKRGPAVASSPAPSDPGNGNGTNTPELLSSKADVSSRPRLSISRGPVFIPASEGSEFYRTEHIGVNRVGFRYVPAGINLPGHVLPCRTIESNPTSYRVSWEDRSPFVLVTMDGLGLLGTKGFRSARCNAPIREGKWYMEVKVIHGGGERVSEDSRKEGSHVRLGWGRREAPLNGPVGLDGYSYGYRDKTGEKVTLSRPRPYGQSFSSGDVIGMYISLPPRRQANKDDPQDPAHIKRERIAIDLKGQEVFEMLEYPQSKEMTALMDYSGKSSTSTSLPSTTTKKAVSGKLPERGPAAATRAEPPLLQPLPTLPDSRISFFMNGKCQGIAFQDLYDYLQLRVTDTSRKGREKKRAREGVKEHRENPFDDGTLGYYPFISLFNDARVQLNPGPDFYFPPPDDIDALLDGVESSAPVDGKNSKTWKPVCERYAQFMAEQWELDEREEEEAKVEAVQIATQEKIEAEKRAQRAKKRQQAEARKRAKKAGEQAVEDDRLTPSILPSGLGQPSPLRHATAFEPEGSAEPLSRSPALTTQYTGDFGPFSGYNSEIGEGDVEMLFERSEAAAGELGLYLSGESPWCHPSRQPSEVEYSSSVQ